MRGFAILFFVIIAWGAQAQEFDNAFHLGWNVLTPLTGKEYAGSTSVAGLRIGYSKFLGERMAIGFEGGYSVLDQYIPTRTYAFEGGAITTDRFNYLYYFTLMANGQYHFPVNKYIMPYASLGLGVAFSKYTIFYNVYQDGEDIPGFVMRPEIGTLIRINEYSGFGFKTAVGFDYATNGSDRLGTDNLAGLNFQLGIVFMNR